MGSLIKLNVVLFDKAGHGALQLEWVWGSSMRLDKGWLQLVGIWGVHFN